MIFRENAAATRLRLVFSLDAILRAFNLARVNSLFPHKPKDWQIGARLRRETLLAHSYYLKIIPQYRLHFLRGAGDEVD